MSTQETVLTPTAEAGRGAFASRLGFILATAGSAIGLGNIWRFPYTTGQNGGAAFVLVYLGFVVLFGIPLLLAELSMGRASQRSAVGAFRALVPGTWWPLVGGLGVLTGFGILAFYSVVAGWTVGYVYKAATGQFTASMTAQESGAIFGALIGDPVSAIGLTGLFLLLTMLVVRGGIQKGIERASKILMPLFFLFVLALALRSLALEGAWKGLAFLFSPDFSKITPRVVMGAMGQALFSLSLGMGAIITYGSYLTKKESLPVGGSAVALFDTTIAVLAGVMIFPALFTVGVDPKAGPGLVFVVLPTIFMNLPAGTLFAVVFYVLLAIAALTSTISLLEVVVAYFVDERGWGREKAVWIVGGACFLLAIPSALSNGASPFLSTLLGSKGGFLDLQNILFGNIALSVGAFFICLFVGWKWGVKRALQEMTSEGQRMPGAAAWGFLIKYVCPLGIAAVLAFLIWSGEFF